MCDGLRDVACSEMWKTIGVVRDDAELAGWCNRLMKEISDTTELVRRAEIPGGKGSECGENSVHGSHSGVSRMGLGSADLGLGAAAQEEHLAALSADLSELNRIGETLSETFDGHNNLMDTLETKSSSLEDRTRAVRRKADRISDRVVSCQFRFPPCFWRVRPGVYLGGQQKQML